MTPAARRVSRPRRLLVAGLALALAAGVAGCAGRSNMTTGSVSSTSSLGKPVDQMSSAELHSAADSLGKRYASNPSDKQTAMGYASVLQMNGRADQSLAVMRKLAISLPKDREVLAASDLP